MGAGHRHEPRLVTHDQINVYDDTDDGGLRVGVAIDDAMGSHLAFGLKWIEPGTEPVSWHADGATHETYYVHTGSLKVGWAGSDSGSAVINAGDCFYLAPGRRYSIENAGTTQVFAVWSSTPANSGGGS